MLRPRISGAATERDEIMEAWWLFFRAERTYVYSFSLYLPKDFPQTSERLVIAQWRQLCVRHCVPDNPILALRYEMGRLQVTRNDEHGKTLLYQGDEDVQGRWLDFRFTARWDRTAKGAVDAALDGREIAHYMKVRLLPAWIRSFLARSYLFQNRTIQRCVAPAALDDLHR